MAPLDIYAGPGAMNAIKKYGFLPRLFKYFLGASGGPKWFVLAGLDRVLFPDWLRQGGGQLHVIGSSAGAFRAACAVQQDPLAAINRLADHYAHTEYSARPGPSEITDKARQLIKHMLGSEGKLDLLTNDRFKAHFVVARCRGPVKSDNALSQLTGLAMSAAANSLNRRHLGRFYSRCVFSAPGATLQIDDHYNIPTEYYELGHNSISTSLLASGSIPMVLQGVNHIIGAPPGTYRDGGIVDYHFDLKLGPEPGLVLYPHFYPFATPGWFDKRLKNRIPHSANYENTVMLVPSSEFVANLPFGKIPDRKDFETMDAATRIKYWNTVLSESDRLGDYFMTMAQQPSFIEHIKPLPFAMNQTSAA